MPHTPNFTAQLENKEFVMKAAAAIGCVQTRGEGKGQGSIREMLENIGGGECLVMHHIFDEPDKMRRVARRIWKMTDDMHPHDDLYEILRGLSKALETAADLRNDSEEGAGND